VQIAVKMIDWGSGVPVLALIEKKGAEWQTINVLYQFDDPTVAQMEAIAKVAGGLPSWVKTDLMPAINAALLERFPPSSVPVPGTSDIISLIDQTMLYSLRFVPQVDGTLRVEA
jgi:hypothetical protein